MRSPLRASVLASTALILFGLGLGLGLGACASAPRSPGEHPADQGPWSGTAALLDYEYETQEGSILQEGCELLLHRTEVSGSEEPPASRATQDFSLKLPPNRPGILIDMPAGRYEAKRLECPHYRKWSIDRFANGNGFTIRPGFINFLGRVRFRFDHDATSLSLAFADRTDTAKGLARNLQELPASWHPALLNAITGRPISAPMLQSESEFQLDMHTRTFIGETEASAAPAARVPTEALLAELRSCEQAERARDILEVGAIRYVATYEKGRLSRLTKARDDQSFTEQFVRCVTGALTAFRPSTARKIEFTVKF